MLGRVDLVDTIGASGAFQRTAFASSGDDSDLGRVLAKMSHDRIDALLRRTAAVPRFHAAAELPTPAVIEALFAECSA